MSKSIKERTSGLLWLDENKDLNLSLDSEWYYGSFCKLVDDSISKLKYFQEMLEHYKIKKLWIHREEESKEILKKMEKIVWDTQSSAYAKKQGMTNTEFLRWRLIGAKLGETGKEKINEK
ncbi:hypothetical protein HY750_02665 [Candidatus Kuenenbacteria bacterium]|nr:hypothetical protein [Candidatus Kuenenbacteria bacterium]